MGGLRMLGFKAVENPIRATDLHATSLYLLGLGGRDFRLTDRTGEVVKDIIDGERA
jgi:hypothetical protein